MVYPIQWPDQSSWWSCTVAVLYCGALVLTFLAADAL
jgi:hypothetical protein